jgi:hypothetical protein
MASGADPELLDDVAFLARELELLELELHREILIARAERGSGGKYDEFAGLVVSDKEIDRYLEPAPPKSDPELAATVERVARKGALLAERLARDVSAALAAGRELRLAHLREAFSLTPAEYRAFVACLAPDVELRFERYFAYLQDDVAKKRPTVELLGRLFFADAPAAVRIDRLLTGRRSLAGERLLEPARDADVSLPARELRVPAGAFGFLLGSEAPDPALGGLGRLRPSRPLTATASYFEHHRRHVARLLAFAVRDGRLPVAYVRAPEGCGKEDLVLAVAHGLGASVFECGLDELVAYPGDLAEWFAALERDLRLCTAFLWLRGGDARTPNDAERLRLRALGRHLDEHPGVNVVVSGRTASAELAETLELELLELELPAPDMAERLELWRCAFAADTGGVTPEIADTLAAKFKFGPGRISDTLRQLQSRELPEEELTERAIHRVCRTLGGTALESRAQRARLNYTWEDLVLPAETIGQLRDISDAVRFRAKVHGDWGFARKFSLGKGLGVLFSGPSGTGKTMSAEVLANELELELYKIDLSSVVSKYIGETEKNLSQIFREAERAHGILLFDEADALFGKRSEVKDSHDRYANIEINFLLQRLEEYEGIVILTTNMAKNLDAAFTRRIQFTVEFPVPDEQQRGRLWSQVFPAAMPRDADLDLEFLAKRFKLSGANIKSVAVQSAFLAASNGGVVTMGHVINAISREYRKLGKLASRSEFGAYYHLLRGDGSAGHDAEARS